MKHKAFAISVALITFLLILPILLVDHLPLLDNHSHESRLYVIRNLLLTGVGSRFYEIDTMLLPNIGFDIPGMFMAGWMEPETVGRVFFGTTVVLMFTGVVALSRVAIGRWSVVSLAAALLLYNLFTLLGFLSYGMGIALMFWALTGRLLLERAAAPIRLVVGSLFGIVLLFNHVSAFGIYAVMLAGFGLDMLLRRRASLLKVVLMGAETLPALLLFALMSTAGQGRMRYETPYWHTKIFNAVKAFSSGSFSADVAFLVGALSVAALVIAGGRTRLSRPLVPGLVMLTILYFAIPAHVSGGSYVDSRIPVVVVLLTLAAIDFEVRPRSRLALVLMLVAGGAYVTKQGALAALWYDEGRRLSNLAAVFESLPDGAVILQAECSPDSNNIKAVYANRQPPLTHVAAMAALTGRRFAAVTWTLKGQQPVRTVPAYTPYKRFQEDFGFDICTAGQYASMLDKARALAAQQASSGGVVAPLYLMLLRPSVEGTLRPVAPLVAQTPEVELYAVEAAK